MIWVDTALNRVHRIRRRLSAWRMHASRRIKPVSVTWPTFDVSNEQRGFNLDSLAVLDWAPASMTRAERLLLFTLAYSLRPQRYLEIGTLNGGSALIVAAAMDALSSSGRIYCVDPAPRIDPAHWSILEQRGTLIQGLSPDVVKEAKRLAGGPFDMVLIDGDHSYVGALRDAEGVLPHLSSHACVIFHDGYNPDVAAAINAFVRRNRGRIVDDGLVTREVTHYEGENILWSGFHVLHMRS